MPKRMFALLMIGAIVIVAASVTGISLATTPTPVPESATPTRRPSPYPSPTLSEALVVFDRETPLFAAPDNTSDILFPAVPANAFARLHSVTQDQRWYEVEIGNTIGWVSSAAVRMVGRPSGLYQIVTLTPEPAIVGATPTIAPIATERMVGTYPTVRFDARIEVYPGPSPFYPPVGAIVAGQSAEILALTHNRRDWYLIRYENGAGWVPNLSGEVQGDLATVPMIAAPPEPTFDNSRLQFQSPDHVAALFPSATPLPDVPPVQLTPTLAAMPPRVAETIEVILEPDVPAGSYTAEQLAAAADTVRARLEQYFLTDYTVEIDEAASVLRIRFEDSVYRDEIFLAIQQEGLFEAVNFSDQSVELRAALLGETILTSGYRRRESERLDNMIATYGVNGSDELAALGFTFSDRRRNLVDPRPNQPFQTLFTDEAVAGASLVPGTDGDVIITLTDEGIERLQGYPFDRFLAFTMDGRVIAAPVALDVRSPFVLKRYYYDWEPRLLVVLLRTGSLPFGLRPRQITFLGMPPTG